VGVRTRKVHMDRGFSSTLPAPLGLIPCGFALQRKMQGGERSKRRDAERSRLDRSERDEG
jgi:hypothetical protein